MPKRPITNCGGCAYVQKQDGRMWCPFHDLPVNSKLVCDDFIDEYDSPQWASLTKGLTEGVSPKRKVPQYTGLDILAYLITGVLLVSVTVLFFVAHM